MEKETQSEMRFWMAFKSVDCNFDSSVFVYNDQEYFFWKVVALTERTDIFATAAACQGYSSIALQQRLMLAVQNKKLWIRVLVNWLSHLLCWMYSGKKMNHRLQAKKKFEEVATCAVVERRFGQVALRGYLELLALSLKLVENGLTKPPPPPPRGLLLRQQQQP